MYMHVWLIGSMLGSVSSVCGPFYRADEKVLEKIQRKFTRIIILIYRAINRMKKR